MNWKRDFDWDGAIKHHGEALKRIVAALFAMLGEATVRGFAPSSPRRAAGAPARRIRRPPPHCHRSPGCCGEAGAFAAHAQGENHRKGGGSRLPSFQLFDPRKHFADQASAAKVRENTHASISSDA